MDHSIWHVLDKHLYYQDIAVKFIIWISWGLALRAAPESPRKHITSRMEVDITGTDGGGSELEPSPTSIANDQ